jgi:hypothetical protein
VKPSNSIKITALSDPFVRPEVTYPRRVVSRRVPRVYSREFVERDQQTRVKRPSPSGDDLPGTAQGPHLRKYFIHRESGGVYHDGIQCRLQGRRTAVAIPQISPPQLLGNSAQPITQTFSLQLLMSPRSALPGVRFKENLQPCVVKHHGAHVPSFRHQPGWPSKASLNVEQGRSYLG